MKKTFLLTAVLFFAAAVPAATAQIAQNGDYAITQAVIGAGGGTTNNAGNGYKIEGTIGQPAAGTNLSGGTFTVKGGFWTTSLAPTAAGISIGGRVVVEGASGKGIRGVRVTLTDANGTTRTVLTGAGGKYRFDELEAGQIYIFTVTARRYTFSQPTVAYAAIENFDDLNFSGSPQF